MQRLYLVAVLGIIIVFTVLICHLFSLGMWKVFLLMGWYFAHLSPCMQSRHVLIIILMSLPLNLSLKVILLCVGHFELSDGGKPILKIAVKTIRRRAGIGLQTWQLIPTCIFKT